MQVDALGGTVAAEHAADRAGRGRIGRSDGAPAQALHGRPAPGAAPARRRARAGRSISTAPTTGTRSRTSRCPGRTTGTSCGTAAPATVRFGPRVRYADGTVRQHGAHPARRRPDRGDRRTARRRRARATSARGTLTVLRSTVAVRRGVTNLRPASGGVDAETRRRGQGPRPADAAHRPASGDGGRLRAADARGLDRGGPGPLPAAPAAATAGAAAGRARRCAATPSSHRLDDFAISAPLMRHDHASTSTSTAWSAPPIEVGTPYYQGVSRRRAGPRAARPAGRPGAPARRSTR